MAQSYIRTPKLTPQATKLYYLLCVGLFMFATQLAVSQTQDQTIPFELPDGWLIKTTQGDVAIRLYTSHIAEIEFQPALRRADDSSHAVILKPAVIPHQSIQLSPTRWQLKTEELEFHLNTLPFKLSILRKGDTLIGHAANFSAKPGESQVVIPLDKDEQIYGAGERSVPLNRRGFELPLYNKPNYGYGVGATSLNYSVPVIISSKKYLMLWDNPRKGVVDVGKRSPNQLIWKASGGQARYFIIGADSYPALMIYYTQLTGRQKLPPRWALGNLQSRMAYRNQEETDSIVRLMMEKDFPIDAIILDFYWFGDSIKGHLGRLDWYKPSWPDPQHMIRKFRSLGVKSILITEPYVIDSLDNYSDGVANQIFTTDSLGKTYLDTNFYFGHGSLIDLFKPSAQDWFWQRYRRQIENGIAGWWGDLGEPESHPSDIVHVNGKADEVHSIYGHHWDKMLFEKYAKHYPHTRLFHLQRSGYAGSQRYSAFPWTGDVGRSWSGLQAQLPVLLSMGINGLGYIHSDAGGFALGEKDDELYTRWLQFATFTPILRPHGSGVPSEPVFYEPETQRIVRNYMKLRYALLPYNYTLAWQNASLGFPLMRPLFFSYPGDTTAVNINDQYLWGENLMVAPVVEPRVNSRRVYLPAGGWYNYHSGEYHTGDQWIEEPVTLDNIPLYARAGAFIPTSLPVNSTDFYKANHYIVRYYPFGQSAFTQYEDDGLNNQAMEQQLFELITYTGVQTASGCCITLNSTGDWPGKPSVRKMTFQVRSAKEPNAVKLNGLPLPRATNADDGYWFADSFIHINFRWQGNPVEIVVE